MTPLTGLGIWIWELPKCEGGHVPSIVAKAKRCGVSFLLVKAGDEKTNGQVTPELVTELRAGGIECGAWWYSGLKELELQCALLEDLVKRCGVRHVVMDAEDPWDVPDNRPLAKTFAAMIRKAIGPDTYFADAPWARPLSHGGSFPYAEFGAICDARMPQFYWEVAEAGGLPCAKFLPDCDAQWTAIAPGQTICPAGSPVDYKGTKHAPVSETRAFLDRYFDRPARTLWSWQHLEDEWALLEERAREPEPIPDPLAAEAAEVATETGELVIPLGAAPDEPGEPPEDT